MHTRLSPSMHAASAGLFAAGLFGMSIHAASIPAQETFFPPSSLVEGLYPSQPVSGDGASVPWTAVWSVADIEALDPTRVDIRLAGMQILPLLLPNPETTEGEYSDEDLALINEGNFWQYYAHLPSEDIEAFDGDYDAAIEENGPGFEDDLLRMRTVRTGIYMVRVRTLSRAAPEARLEPKEYLFSQPIADGFGLDVADGESPDVPAAVHRMVFDASAEDEGDEGGLAGPPGKVHIVSENDPNDNGYLTNACAALVAQGKDPQKADTVQKVIDAVCVAMAANNGPVELVLYGHGTGPNHGVANGRIKIGTERICNAGPNCVMTPEQFGTAIKGKVTKVVFYSCYTGSDLVFLQQVADAAGVPAAGYSSEVTAGGASTIFGWVVSDAYLNTNGKGKKKKKEPHGCKSGGCTGDFNADDMVDGADLGFLLRTWGEAGCTDLNDDSTTDGADLGVLFGAWGPCN